MTASSAEPARFNVPCKPSRSQSHSLLFPYPLSFADSTNQKYGSLSHSAPSLPITLDDIELSVIAAFIGLAVTLPITYLIVDRIIDNNEKKKLGPIEKLAKERLRSKLANRVACLAHGTGPPQDSPRDKGGAHRSGNR